MDVDGNILRRWDTVINNNNNINRNNNNNNRHLNPNIQILFSARPKHDRAIKPTRNLKPSRLKNYLQMQLQIATKRHLNLKRAENILLTSDAKTLEALK